MSNVDSLPADLKKPRRPKIRRDYVSHCFPTEYRKTLDAERNAQTEEMTRTFYETHERGIFSGWKCQKDWGLAHPANPEILVGTRVGKVFDGIVYYGTVSKFDTWWEVAYDDGTNEDYNYHELTIQLEPEDGEGWELLFADFVYHPPDGTTRSLNCAAMHMRNSTA